MAYESRPTGPRKLTAEDLKAIIDAEIRSGMGELSGELTTQRSDAMDRYLGEPDGREMEGRSQVNARDVLEVVEWILPSLARIFMTTRAIEVDPVGPEDEQQADQETDYLRHLFFKKNDGFLVLYTWFKDSLLQKTGIVKTHVEEHEEQHRETYTGLSDAELAALAADDEVEIIEQATYEAPAVLASITGQPMTLNDVVAIHTERDKRIVIENIPPEEFLISRDARTPFPEDARFTAHYTNPTVSELLEQGFTWNDISQMELGLNEAEWNEESLSRRHLSDEQRWIETDTANQMMQQVKLTEAYIKADMDGDGIAEQLKVLRSGDYISWEEVDDVPFDAVTPVLLPHKFFGLSIADLVQDIQEIRTGLLRAYMDNIHQTINGTTYYNDRVNVDDMLTSRPYGQRYVEGTGPVSDAVLHIPPSGLPPQSFSLDELIDKLKQQRIGDFQSQLDPSVLKEANNGVVVEMINEAKAKVEMIARVFAETGVRSLFRRMHKLARMHGDKEEIVRLRNTWTNVNPAQWRERTDFTVRVGLGTRNRQEAMVNAMQRLQLMEKIGQTPYAPAIMPPDRVYRAVVEFEEAMDETNPGKFWQDPAQYQPPPPPPDAQMEAVKATLQIEQQKRQIEAAELQQKERKAQIDAQIAASKQQIDQLKADVAAGSSQAKTAMEAQAKQLEQQIKALELALKEQDMANKSALDLHKAELDSATKLTQTAMQTGAQIAGAEAAADSQSEDTEDTASASSGEAPAPSAKEADQVGKVLASLMDAIEDIRGQMNAPREFKRDKDGRVVSINGRSVRYDDMGRLAGIG